MSHSSVSIDLALTSVRALRALMMSNTIWLCSAASLAQCTCAPFADRVALELLQIVGEMGQRVLLDRRRQRAQLLPLGQLLALPVALLAQVPQPLVVEVEMVLGLDELRRRFGVVDAFHSRAPFRICAMWMNLIGRPSRSAHPF